MNDTTIESRIRDHFGLSRLPFSKNTGPTQIFRSRQIEEVSARLSLAAQNEDIALLTGPVGSGKSSALRLFAQSLDSTRFRLVYIPAYPYKIGEIAKLILSGLQVQPPAHGSKALRLLDQTVIELSRDKGIKPVIVIDEAQELPLLTLQTLKNLVNFDMDSASRLTLILCGQKELAPILDSVALESLYRRIKIICEMSALSLEDTSKYIRHQMKLCGVEKAIFTDECVAQIFSMSQGLMSQINVACFRLIVLAVSEGKDIIEPSMIERVGSIRQNKI
jgi:type II secretory pathway predicted ATPase ExeA